MSPHRTLHTYTSPTHNTCHHSLHYIYTHHQLTANTCHHSVHYIHTHHQLTTNTCHHSVYYIHIHHQLTANTCHHSVHYIHIHHQPTANTCHHNNCTQSPHTSFSWLQVRSSSAHTRTRQSSGEVRSPEDTICWISPSTSSRTCFSACHLGVSSSRGGLSENTTRSVVSDFTDWLLLMNGSERKRIDSTTISTDSGPWKQHSSSSSGTAQAAATEQQT